MEDYGYNLLGGELLNENPSELNDNETVGVNMIEEQYGNVEGEGEGDTMGVMNENENLLQQGNEEENGVVEGIGGNGDVEQEGQVGNEEIGIGGSEIEENTGNVDENNEEGQEGQEREEEEEEEEEEAEGEEEEEEEQAGEEEGGEEEVEEVEEMEGSIIPNNLMNQAQEQNQRNDEFNFFNGQKIQNDNVDGDLNPYATEIQNQNQNRNEGMSMYEANNESTNFPSKRSFNSTQDLNSNFENNQVNSYQDYNTKKPRTQTFPLESQLEANLPINGNNQNYFVQNQNQNQNLMRSQQKQFDSFNQNIPQQHQQHQQHQQQHPQYQQYQQQQIQQQYLQQSQNLQQQQQQLLSQQNPQQQQQQQQQQQRLRQQMQQQQSSQPPSQQQQQMQRLSPIQQQQMQQQWQQFQQLQQEQLQQSQQQPQQQQPNQQEMSGKIEDQNNEPQIEKDIKEENTKPLESTETSKGIDQDEPVHLQGHAMHFARTIETYGGVDMRMLAAITQRKIGKCKQELGVVDIQAVIMSLRSGTLMNQVWALNILTILANDYLVELPLVSLPLILSALCDLLNYSLSKISPLALNPSPLFSTPSISILQLGVGSNSTPANTTTTTTETTTNPNTSTTTTTIIPPTLSQENINSVNSSTDSLSSMATNNTNNLVSPSTNSIPSLFDLMYLEKYSHNILFEKHQERSPSNLVHHQEWALCIENIFRGLSFSPEHAPILGRSPAFSSLLIHFMTKFGLEHRKNALVIFSNIASRFVFQSQKDAEDAFFVLVDSIITTSESERANLEPKDPATTPTNAKFYFSGELSNPYTTLCNWEVQYFSQICMESLVLSLIVVGNNGFIRHCNPSLISTMITKLASVIQDDITYEEDFEKVETAILAVYNILQRNETSCHELAKHKELIPVMINFARVPIYGSNHKPILSLMKYSSQCLRTICKYPSGRSALLPHEHHFVESIYERNPFSPLLADIVWSLTHDRPPEI